MSDPTKSLRMDVGEHAEFAIQATRGGVPLNLTGLTLHFALSTAPGATPLLTKSTGAGIVHDPDQTANPGKATLTLRTADTASIPPLVVGGRQSYWWDIWVYDGTGEKQRLGEPQQFFLTRGVAFPSP